MQLDSRRACAGLSACAMLLALQPPAAAAAPPPAQDCSVRILDAGLNAADHVQIARWDSSFEGTAAAPVVKAAFAATDPERFVVEIIDVNGGAGPITANLQSFAQNANPATAAPIDEIKGFQLTLADDGGTFRSAPRVLVVNNDSVDDNFAQVPDVDGTDDGADDPTLFGAINGKVRVTYATALGKRCEVIVDVCDKDPAETKKIALRATILKLTPGGALVVPQTEVREDITQMDNAWAQCCLRFAPKAGFQLSSPPSEESFSDEGFGAPAVGAGNGTFDFTDTDNDNLHDNGEPSEPFTDANGNMGYDYAVNLANGLDEFATAGPLALVPTREERNLIDSLSDADPKTIEYFAVNELSAGSKGEAFIPSEAKMKSNLKVTNVVIMNGKFIGIDNNGVPRAFVTAAHEAGHVLLDSGRHTDQTTLAGRVNLMKGGGTDNQDGVTNSKRLTEAQCTKARSF